VVSVYTVTTDGVAFAAAAANALLSCSATESEEGFTAEVLAVGCSESEGGTTACVSRNPNKPAPIMMPSVAAAIGSIQTSLDF
jgi:hypothetical protein